MPGQYIPSTDFFELLKFDKWVHAGIFYVLMLLCLNTIYTNRLNSVYVLIFMALCISYGGLLEIMQAKLFSNRSADVLDFIANSFGCLAGFAFHYFYLRKQVTQWDFLNKESNK
jgi:VanZ family protein